MPDWNDLPLELKRLVFDAIERQSAKEGSTWKIAPLASVNTEWRDSIEAITFRSLRIVNTQVSSFADVFRNKPRRQACLQHLCYVVELPKYHSKLAYFCENHEEQDENDAVFSGAVWHLFSILDKDSWDVDSIRRAARTAQHNGLALELLCRSPSDKPALFGDQGFSDDGDSRFFDSHLDLYMGSMHELYGKFGLPDVHVVTTFCLLRNNHRYIAPRALLHIFHSLPCLARLDYEPYHLVSEASQREFDRDLAANIPFWPSTIKDVTIFRHSDIFNMDDEAWGGPDKKIPLLARNLEAQSHDLEELAISHLIDAEHFFEPFYHPRRRLRLPYWANLRLFTMTSDLICSGRDADELKGMLTAAGHAAKRMPVLRVMELYNAEPGEGGIFRYLAVGGKAASISWQSTWSYTIPDSVRKVWAAAAEQGVQRLPLNVISERILQTYKGPAKFIHAHVVTRPAVMHPISWQSLLGKKGASAAYEPWTAQQARRPLAASVQENRRDQEIAEATRKIEYLTREVERLRALDENAEADDKRLGYYNSHFFSGDLQRDYLPFSSRKEKIEVSYEDDADAMDLTNDNDDDDAWETE